MNCHHGHGFASLRSFYVPFALCPEIIRTFSRANSAIPVVISQRDGSPVGHAALHVDVDRSIIFSHCIRIPLIFNSPQYIFNRIEIPAVAEAFHHFTPNHSFVCISLPEARQAFCLGTVVKANASVFRYRKRQLRCRSGLIGNRIVAIHHSVGCTNQFRHGVDTDSYRRSPYHKNFPPVHIITYLVTLQWLKFMYL